MIRTLIIESGQKLTEEQMKEMFCLLELMMKRKAGNISAG
jgi:uncharacterized protein YneF (UPF0154 family)